MATTPEELAVKVATKANDLLQPMQTEMDMRKWPADLRKIMWQAVADTAAALAAEQAWEPKMRLSNIFGSTPQSDAEALERAADAAHEDGDYEHEKRLREAALFKRRVARERAAGFTGWSPMAFKDL